MPDVITLREHIDVLISIQEARNAERLRALEELYSARQQALALAVEKQEAAYDARFMGMNEWRQTYGDLVNKAVSREVFDALAADFERRLVVIKSDYDRRLAVVEQKQAAIDGRFLGYAGGISVVFLIIVIGTQLLGIGG